MNDRSNRVRNNEAAGNVAADEVEAVDFSEDEQGAFDPAALTDMETVAAVEAIMGRAVELQASDVFLHTDQYSVDIAIRRLGIVQRLAIVSLEKGRHLISYAKAMAGMDIAEHRRPMDGRWLYEGGGRTVDLRVNTIATLFGEDMTMRLWDREVGLRSISHLGMTSNDLNKLTAMLSSPSGLILVTGPTGTGKTTTLYACLQHLNNGSRKINTLEDPVEYAIPGIRQAQINPKLELDFPELLLNVLRQAPDVIMVGEIRDQQTAATAVRAANSGHLVLATLHAPVAGGAVQSMLALGSHPFFLSSCLLGVVAQRLVRTLCPNCRMAYDISEAPQTFAAIADLLGPGEGKAIYGPGGCEQCLNGGYVARSGLFEVMTLNQSIRRLVAASRPSEEIERAAIEAGMVEFRRGAMLKVAQGVTSTEEILRDVPQEYLGLED